MQRRTRRFRHAPSLRNAQLEPLKDLVLQIFGQRCGAAHAVHEAAEVLHLRLWPPAQHHDDRWRDLKVDYLKTLNHL